MKMRLRRLPVAVIGAAAAILLGLHSSSASAAESSVGRVVATGNMTVARFSHTATLLPNGKVLIAGGMARNGVVEGTAELYDPAAGRFTSLGKLQSPRGWGSTATLLPNGKVLIAGGASGSWCSMSCYLASAELYDPATNTFTSTGNMTRPRASAFAVLLRNGDVLIAGGEGDVGNNSLAGAELYHASQGVFTATGGMSKSNEVRAAVLLKSGKVLVVGGVNGGEEATAAAGETLGEIYDPSTGRFTLSGKMITPRTKVGTTLLPDGRVLIAGGQIDGAQGQRIATSEIYDPASGAFTSGPTMNFKRYKFKNGIVALGNGLILVAGGADQPEVYNPASGLFQAATPGSKLDGFCYSTTTLLTNGEVLLVGGYGYHPGDGAVNHAWLYKP